MRFEAWYDSLTLEHRMPAARLRPDTDGLIGGRWLGWLGPTGGVELDTRPFMPPAIREVADLSETFADFFPPLATAALAVGARWRDSAGVDVERRPDSAAVPRSLRRYAWRVETVAPGDTGLKLGERLVERGAVAWDDSLGPVAWSRELSIETQLRPRPREAVRSLVTRRISVRRVPPMGSCR